MSDAGGEAPNAADVALRYGPQWIEPLQADSRGFDHLGLASVAASQMLGDVLPAINVLTVHPRYHAFYCFLVDEFWRTDSPRSWAQLGRFIKAREFIFAIACNLCERPEHLSNRSIVGTRKAGPLARQRLAAYDVTTPYFGGTAGGYGQYYRAVMVEMGEVIPGVTGGTPPVDGPHPIAGVAMAEAFRRQIKSTAYYNDFFQLNEGEVPYEVVHELGQVACLCQLQTTTAADADEVRRAYLGGGRGGESRALSFRLLLDVLNQNDGIAIDSAAFRQLLYFGSSTSGARYSPREELEPQRAKWRMWQAREYFGLAINAVWLELILWGVPRSGGGATPVPLEEARGWLADQLDIDGLAKHLAIAQPGLDGASPLDQVCSWVEASSGHAELPNSDDLVTSFNEHLLAGLLMGRKRPKVRAAAALALLILLECRFRSAPAGASPAAAWMSMGEPDRISMRSVFRSIQRHQERGSALRDFAEYLLNRAVIRQHQVVALGKVPNNTFRFYQEGAALRFIPRGDAEVGWASSRFDAFSTSLVELGFCTSVTGPDHGITPLGHRLLDGAQ